MDIKAPYLPLEKLREIATQTLTDYHVTAATPIPIDNIVEFGFEIDIVPVPGLQDVVDQVASISSDLKTIYVDEFVYKSRESRYRYSVAHELAHRIIHEDIFKKLTYNSFEEWKQVITSIPPDQYSWIERQAYWLAGLLLVPSKPLRNAYDEATASANTAGISLALLDKEELKRTVCAQIGRDVFSVSKDVIFRRVKEDGLWSD